MRFSIKKQFLMLFLLIAGIAVIILAIMLRTTLDKSFYDYKWEYKTKIFSILVENLENYYNHYQTWASFNGNEIGKLAMKEGCYFTLYDKNKRLVWTSEHTRPVRDTAYWRNIFPVNYKGELVGTVYIGQLTESIYTPQDIIFQDSILKAILLSLFLALLVSLPFIIAVSTRLSDPIKQLQVQAENMIQGRLSKEVEVKSYTLEVLKLSNSLNKLRLSLLEQETLRKQLASDISHELRTPLNIIQNQLEAIIDGIFEPTEERLEGLRSEMVRLTSLVGELEKITLIESDSFIPDVEDVKLEDVINNAKLTFEAAFQRKGVELKVDLQKGIYVKAQKDKLTQVIINIVSNALKFTDEGSVTIKTYMSQDDYAVFEVIDTGSGLSDEDKTKIFERFYRVEKSRNRNAGGAGLGLAIVKKIIDAHGWKIEVESDGHSGTTFRVKF